MSAASTPVMPVPVRRGPRKECGETRSAILDAASALFRRHGYVGTTLRAIAEEAGCDVALISYYFGTKGELFVEATRLPARPEELIELAFADGPDSAAENLARGVLRIWESDSADEPLKAFVLSLAEQPETAALMRTFLERSMVRPLAAQLPRWADETERDRLLRAEMIASTLIGLEMTRFVVRAEPIASAPIEDLVALTAPRIATLIVG